MTWIFICDFFHISEGTKVNDNELRKIISEVYDYKIQTGIKNEKKLLEKFFDYFKSKNDSIKLLIKLNV